MKKIKAIGLFSGGLDSMIAAKLIQGEGIDVLAINFLTNFFGQRQKLEKAAKDNGIKLRIIDVSRDYWEKIVKKPRHGYGKNMNPCIDCKIFMLKEALRIMKKEKASFVFSGEVLGQRSMSQRNTPLKIIQKESGLNEKLLRPLSAKILPRTEAEEKGWVRRERLLGIEGRSRKKQFELARQYNLSGYSSPSGGCLLTEESYANKLRDLLRYDRRSSAADAAFLQVGRHFRFGRTKVVVGRDAADNEIISREKKRSDLLFQAKDAIGPTTLLRGPKTAEAVSAAAYLTARYGDNSEKRDVLIAYGTKFKKKILIHPGDKDRYQDRMIK